MTASTEDIRLAVYRWFAETGRAPGTADIAGRLGVRPDEVNHRLRELHTQHQLVVDSKGHILLAQPFAAVPLGFAVMGSNTLWWAGCAWDSFALVHLLPDESELLVSTRCPGCGAAHAWNVTRDGPPAGTQLAHFLVPAARMFDDIMHTCTNQRVFCGTTCVRDWLGRTGNQRGYVTSMPTLWELAAHWYAGRLERGHVYPDPTRTATDLRRIGLSGPFWGL